VKYSPHNIALECGSLLPLCYSELQERNLPCNKATAGRRTPKLPISGFRHLPIQNEPCFMLFWRPRFRPRTGSRIWRPDTRV